MKARARSGRGIGVFPVLILAGLLAAGLWSRWDAVPRYEGKTLDEWLDALGVSDSNDGLLMPYPEIYFDSHPEPAAALTAMAPATFPRLIRDAFWRETRWDKVCAWAAPYFERMGIHLPNPVGRVRRGMLALALSGPQVTNALAEMQVLADTPERMGGLAWILMPQGRVGIDLLVSRLSASPEPEMAAVCLESLAMYHTNAAYALPKVLPWLEHPSSRVRHWALSAIHAFKACDSPCVQALIPMLRSPDSDISTSAGDILADMGPAARDALEAMVEAVPKDPGWMREAWLGRIARVDDGVARRLGYRKESDP